MPSPLPEDVRMALGAGQKIEAIRLLRKHTGLGLAQAKAAVESSSLPFVPDAVGDAELLSPEASAALAAGHKIKAIRLLRQARGIGLKEAKAMIDAAQRRPAQRSSGATTGLAPGEVGPSRLSARLKIVIAVLLGVLTWLLLSNG